TPAEPGPWTPVQLVTHSGLQLYGTPAERGRAGPAAVCFAPVLLAPVRLWLTLCWDWAAHRLVREEGPRFDPGAFPSGQATESQYVAALPQERDRSPLPGVHRRPVPRVRAPAPGPAGLLGRGTRALGGQSLRGRPPVGAGQAVVVEPAQRDDG